MGKEDRNCIPRHLVTLVEDLDAWNDYPWGEYMWAKFYERTINVVDEHWQYHLDEKKKNPNYNATYNLYGFAWAFKIWILESYPNSKQWWSKKDNVRPRLAWTNIIKFDKSHYNHLFGPDSIPIVNLDLTPSKKIQAWFDSSISFFNGIVDEDRKGCGDDFVLVSKDNSVDEDCNVCEDASAGLSKDEIVNDKNNDQLLLEDGDGLFDSEAGCRNSEEDNENQPANVSIRDLYAMIKVHEERIANLERLLKEKLPNDYAAENTKPNMIPNHSNDIPSSNDPLPICSRPDMHNAEVSCDGMETDKLDQMNDYNCSQPITADNMKFQHEEENLPVKDTPLEHQPVDELIDAQKDTTNLLPENLKNEINKSKYVNVVKDDYKPPLETIFAANIKSKKKKCGLQKNYVLSSIQERKKRLIMALGSPYDQLGTTTPAPLKTRSTTSIENTIVAPEFEVEISGQSKIRSLNKLMTLQVFVENLSRPDGCEKNNVTVPDEISEFLKMQDPPEYRFPWGFWDLTVDRIFWLQLACLDLAKKGWLGDSVSYALGNVEKCLAELQISTGVVTFYDTLGWVKGNRRPWWRNMKRNLPQRLTSYLKKHGVLASKGISVEQYEIKYAFPNVVRQEDDSSDCGVWVCIFLYRLSRKQPLAFKDPIQTVLSYREMMLQYFWNHKFAAPKSVLIDEGFGVPPDTLDPIIVKISYPVSGQGVKRLTIKVKENAVHVSSSSSSKPLDIDLNESMSLDQDMAKQLALTVNYGCPIESFSELPIYCHNLKLANEDSVTHIETDAEGRFKMCFIAFGFAFLNSTIKATYEGIVYPVKDIPTWQTPNDLQVVLPLVMGNKLPGRPKNRDRIRSKWEGPILTRCRRCGAIGHNRTACNVPLPSVQNTCIRIDGMQESSNPRDSFMNASHMRTAKSCQCINQGNV
ncbi:phospholipase-like protein [Tanacetum coccineum]